MKFVKEHFQTIGVALGLLLVAIGLYNARLNLINRDGIREIGSSERQIKESRSAAWQKLRQDNPALKITTPDEILDEEGRK